MTPEERDMGERLVDTADWAAVVLIREDGSAEVRGEACPRDVVVALRRLADHVDRRHAGHHCTLPVRRPASWAWKSLDGRVWRPHGISDVAPGVLLYQADGGGDPMPLTVISDLFGPITPVGGEQP